MAFSACVCVSSNTSQNRWVCFCLCACVFVCGCMFVCLVACLLARSPARSHASLRSFFSGLLPKAIYAIAHLRCSADVSPASFRRVLRRRPRCTRCCCRHRHRRRHRCHRRCRRCRRHPPEPAEALWLMTRSLSISIGVGQLRQIGCLLL